MKLIHRLFDGRINAYNFLLEMNLNEYFKLSNTIIGNNDFQRQRVKRASGLTP